MALSSHDPAVIYQSDIVSQQWDSFYQSFLHHHSSKHTLKEATSVLLFVAHDQINSICASLRMYDMDFVKLKKVLEVIEQVCLPRFILLFERFRYFTLKEVKTEGTESGFEILLRRQAEVCGFGTPRKEVDTCAIETSAGQVSVADYLSFDDVLNAYCETVELKDETYALVKDEVGSSVYSTFETPHFLGYDEHDSENQDTFHNGTATLTDVGQSVPREEENRIKMRLSAQRNKIGKLKIKAARSKEVKKRGRPRKVNLKQSSITPVVTCADQHEENNYPDRLAEDESASEKDSVANLLHVSTTAFSESSRRTKQYQCCVCERVFLGARCLQNHLVSKHDDLTEFSCKICNGSFSDALAYLDHFQSTHIAEKAPLKRSVNSKQVTVEEKRTSRDIQKFQCPLCERTFTKECYVQRHMDICHSESFMCWNCGETFQDLRQYKLHAEKHVVVGKFSCDLCQKQNHSIARLIGHLRNHLLPRNKCEICGIVFAKPESLIAHVEKHKNEPNYKCNVCGKKFITKGRMEYHMNMHREKRFTCELCGKSFAQKINLDYHKLCHTGERPYGCKICGHFTRSTGSLNKHMRIHSNSRSYICEVCGRGFNHQSVLHSHRQGHSGKRAFTCDACGRAYIYREGLRTHKKKGHCPGKKPEPGTGRRPRATKLDKLIASARQVETDFKISDLVQGVPETFPMNFQAWHNILRNYESEGGHSGLGSTI